MKLLLHLQLHLATGATRFASNTTSKIFCIHNDNKYTIRIGRGSKSGLSHHKMASSNGDRDRFTILPIEMLQAIASNLDLRDALKLRLISRMGQEDVLVDILKMTFNGVPLYVTPAEASLECFKDIAVTHPPVSSSERSSTYHGYSMVTNVASTMGAQRKLALISSNFMPHRQMKSSVQRVASTCIRAL